jgi:multiple sugar transport system substrate-binding protein
MNKYNLTKFSNFVSVVVILSLMLSLAACSAANTPSQIQTIQKSSPVPTENSQSPSPVPTQALTPLINPTTEQGDVTITFNSSESDRSIFEPVMEEFHQVYPSITVKFIAATENTGSLSMTDYFKAEAVKADSIGNYPNALNVKDYYIDLQPYIDADPSFNSEDFYPGSLSACKDPTGNIIRGIPVSLMIGGIFYDRSAFDAANIPYPQPGWTWDDFRNDVALLTRTQNGGTRYGYANPFYNSILEPIIGISLEKNGGEIDEKSLSAELQWYADMVQKGQLLAHDRWREMFANGNGPALWYGRLTSLSPDLFGNSEETSPSIPPITRWGYVPFPISADGSMDHTTPVYGPCFAISANSPHPDEAWLWLSYLSQHFPQQWFDRQRYSSDPLLFLPARKSVAEEAGFWEGYSDQNQTAIRYSVEHAWYEGMYGETIDTVLVAVQKAAIDGADLTQAIAEAKAQLNTAQ